VLGRAEEIGRASLSEMRRVAATLRGPGDDLDHGPTAPTHTLDDVDTLVARLRATGTQITLEQTGDSSDVEPMTGLAAYRVVQESLVNSTKHAAGASVHVGLEVRPDAVVVEVVDNGHAAHSSGRPGVGIAGMRERVEGLGGSFQAGPTSSGWTVRAHVPRARSQEEKKT
jgi:signal transduction histidine kinase